MYLPKSQIVTNLTTNGTEFSLGGLPYSGSYFKTSAGKYYSGKTPSDPNSLPLTSNSIGGANPQEGQNKNPIQVYTSPTGSLYPESYNEFNPGYQRALGDDFIYKAPLPPIPSITFPTEKQYEVGEFQRFFLKKNNELKYIEVNKSTFNNYVNRNSSVQYELYSSIRINWELTGNFTNVYKVNKNTVRLIESQNNLYGFYDSFKTQFAKYYKFDKGEGLFTDGSEFINRRTRKVYRGFYHVHPTKGPMVGKNHIPGAHDYLDILEDENVGSSIRPSISPKMGGGY